MNLALALLLAVFPGSTQKEWTLLSAKPPTGRLCKSHWEDREQVRCDDYQLVIRDDLVCEILTREDERFSWVRVTTHHEPRCK